MNRIGLFLLYCLFLPACHSTSENQTDRTDSLRRESLINDEESLAGVFYDTLSCADCAGMATKLYLKPDSTFVMEKQHTKQSPVYETGTWLMRDSLIQLVMPDTFQLLKIVNFAQLNYIKPSTDTTGNAGINLKLRRNNSPFQPLQPIPITGIYTAVNDTMTLYICSMKKTYAAALAPEALRLTTRYKQVAKPGSSAVVQAAGHFELRPSLTDTSTQDYFVIEKWESVKAGTSCTQ